MVLGSCFSPEFGEVILLTDVFVLAVILAASCYGQMSAACRKALHRGSAMLALAATRMGARHR